MKSKVIQMGSSFEHNHESLNGPVQLLEFWGYEYLGICRPTPNLPIDTDPDTIWPRPSRWKSKKKINVVIVSPRIALEGLTYDKVTWHPWACALRFIDGDDDVRMDLVLSNRRVGFGHLVQSIQYLGDLCWRQNHPTFAIPHNPPQKEYLYAPREIVEKQLADGDIVKVTVDRPNEHVLIPRTSQISYAQTYNMLQDNVDFIDQFLKAVARFTAHNRALENELSRRAPVMVQDPQNASQPVLGFGNFSGSVSSQVWNQVGQSHTPTGSVISNNLVESSSMNPSKIPFQPPRFAPPDV
ncbi:hypothetical protein MKW98_023654 [Papaver atlanticum]|uniref:Uncharacterized protein n=1 Tax=Papaver atlanticum TaxID=357466 RepID=A0AAD4SX37_9MAGN|nr:hypothetical protein MKW98_023654 [Papaver atlanticum]